MDALISRLRDCLDTHGAEPARWPAAERDALAPLLAASEPARAMLAQARAFERLLASDALPAPSARLRAAILAQAPQPRPGVREAFAELWAMLGGLRLAGPALAGALVLGTTLGVYASPPDTADDDVDLVDVAQLATDYPDFAE